MRVLKRDDYVVRILPNCEARREAEKGGLIKRFKAWWNNQQEIHNRLAHTVPPEATGSLADTMRMLDG